jgi:hypothetical protein
MPWKFDLEGVERSILPEEYAIVAKLLATPFPGNLELRRQLDNPGLQVMSMGEILRFVFKGPIEHAKTEYQVPVEAKSTDVDGMEISVMLHVVDGHLYELEMYRVDGEGISRMPTPGSLHDLFVVGEPF